MSNTEEDVENITEDGEEWENELISPERRV